MHSIRTKITLLTLCAIVVTLGVATVMSTIVINNLGNESSNRILYLLCETGQKNLDSYFESVAQSVKTVAEYAQDDLTGTSLSDLGEHMERVSTVFGNTAHNTSGILTYYYRVDPEVKADVPGFWYVNTDGKGFREHAVTDISLYDTQDQSTLVWFTVPKATGEPIWLPPYVTENLNAYVLSYNVPVFRSGRFIGVIGIEIDYRTLMEAVDNIALYDNGYAFVTDGDGRIIYHPRLDLADLISGIQPDLPEGVLSENTFTRYTYEDVEKQAVSLPLSNGMRLIVAVPISEINYSWQRLARDFLLVSAVLLLIFAVVTMQLTSQITEPLRKLTSAAEQVNAGNYDFTLSYNGKDEVGLLTRTFNQLTLHLKSYIGDLNSLAYADALTSVHNKGSFDIYIHNMQERLDRAGAHPDFAIGVFDCDDLKAVNDAYGHDKGDLYLKAASHLICHVFMHSPVFRIGGDEFAVILQNDDFLNRRELVRVFEKRSDKLCAEASEPWEKVRVSLGVALYEPDSGDSINDVVRRADKLMYEHKQARKAAQHAASAGTAGG